VSQYLAGCLLHKNSREALEGLLARHLAAKRKETTQKTLDEHIPLGRASRSVRRSPKLERLQQARREERLAMYSQVVAWSKLGMSQAAIAQQVGVGHSTVSRWLATGTFPEKKPREQASQLDRYLPYLFARWESGCHTMARLFRELVALGYTGSYESVRDHIVRRLPEGKKNATRADLLSPAPVSSRQASFLFLRRPEELDAQEQETLLSFARAIQKWTGPMTWFSSLRRCYGPVQENTLIPG
jgi:transcriptional regulator with XRE-family HTH domain